MYCAVRLMQDWPTDNSSDEWQVLMNNFDHSEKVFLMARCQQIWTEVNKKKKKSTGKTQTHPSFWLAEKCRFSATLLNLAWTLCNFPLTLLFHCTVIFSPSISNFLISIFFSLCCLYIIPLCLLCCMQSMNCLDVEMCYTNKSAFCCWCFNSLELLEMFGSH